MCIRDRFLLGAYQYLLDWHLEWYIAHEPERWARRKNAPIYECFSRVPSPESRTPNWRLTTAERKRILLNNIYGVDIDPQAVEVTKLSLLLKVLEEENAETLERQLTLFRERALPDLAGNIKCGNSLIGPDFYEGGQRGLFDEEELYRVNAFDWNAEFPEIMKAGGFDAVIGNPPYGLVFHEDEMPYLTKTYSLFGSLKDGYVAFIEKAHMVLKKDGRFGFIIPSAWLGGPSYLALRRFLLGHTIDTIILLPFDVFRDAYVDTLVITTARNEPALGHGVATYEYPKREKIKEINLEMLPINRVPQETWACSDDCKFVLRKELLDIIQRLSKRATAVLSDKVEMKRGVLFAGTLLTDEKTGEDSHRYFEGSIYRYNTIMKAPHWVEYGPKMKEWPKDFKWFRGKRILLRRLVNRRQRLMASMTEDTIITNKIIQSKPVKALPLFKDSETEEPEKEGTEKQENSSQPKPEEVN
mgnify:CR=1 FL=1